MDIMFFATAPAKTYFVVAEVYSDSRFIDRSKYFYDQVWISPL
jgi:hypothetical protein